MAVLSKIRILTIIAFTKFGLYQFFTAQISALCDKELGVKRRLTTIEQEKDAFTKLDLEEQVKQYVADLQVEMAELIHANPQTIEERYQVFLLKKRIVETVLREARIDENREIHVKFRTDFLKLAGQVSIADSFDECLNVSS